MTFRDLLVLSSVAAAMAASSSLPQPKQVNWPENKGCGEVNIILTGFPPYHGPYTGPENYTQEYIDRSLRESTIDLVESGYNMHVILQGLEESPNNIEDRMQGKHWDITGVGFGQRGSSLPDVTERLEDVLFLYRENAPNAPHIFNWSPDTFNDAIKRRVPISDDCSDNPGKLLTYEEVCSPEWCDKVTVVTNGSLEDLAKGPQPQE